MLMMDADAPGVKGALEIAAEAAIREADEKLNTVAELILQTASRTFAAVVASQFDKICWKHDEIMDEKLQAIAERSIRAAGAFGLYSLQAFSEDDDTCDS